MDWVTDQIAIGNRLEAGDAALLAGAGIRSVLSLDGTLRERQPSDLGLSDIASVSLVDGPGNSAFLFRLALEDLDRLLREAPPVFVQCHAGRSRSVVVVAAHLARALDIDPDEAVRMIASKREINITAGLESLLYSM
jgi:protein-tyrosine phosphatase